MYGRCEHARLLSPFYPAAHAPINASLPPFPSIIHAHTNVRYSGAGPTVLRAMVVSTTQLGTYDQARLLSEN